jgi:divalent metal cation (Fe/Co/Zn/Cd) transporter
MVWMSALSVLVPAVVLIAALVYVAFYSTGYTLFQKVVVVIVAFVIVAAAESLMWMAWAGRKGLMAWPQRK